MSARNAETNLRYLFLIKMTNKSVRHVAQKNRLKKCLPLDFPRDINSNHHQQPTVLHAQAAVLLIVRAVHKDIVQVTLY
jgi:hypothetical protein